MDLKPNPSAPRIALLTDTFILGGGLQHIRMIVRNFPEVQFGVFADGGSETCPFDNLPNVAVFTQGYGVGELEAFRPDLIHVHHLRPLLSLLKNPLRALSAPLLFTVHGLHIHQYDFLKGWGNRFKHLLRYNLERHLFARANRVIAVSREDQAFLENRYRLRAVACVPNGIDYRQLQRRGNGPSVSRKSLGISEAQHLFLTVARFPFQKAHDILLTAIGKVQRSLRDHRACFVLIGDGFYFEAMKNLARDLGIEDLVHFLGRRTDVPAFMRISDTFVLPSRWEGFPITLLEAVGCGLPVIASDTYGNREIIRNGESGLLFENENPETLANALITALESKSRMSEMAGVAYQRVTTEYTEENMIEGLRACYSDYINLPPKAALPHPRKNQVSKSASMV